MIKNYVKSIMKLNIPYQKRPTPGGRVAFNIVISKMIAPRYSTAEARAGSAQAI